MKAGKETGETADDTQEFNSPHPEATFCLKDKDVCTIELHRKFRAFDSENSQCRSSRRIIRKHDRENFKSIRHYYVCVCNFHHLFMQLIVMEHLLCDEHSVLGIHSEVKKQF